MGSLCIMYRREMRTKFRLENQKIRVHLEDLGAQTAIEFKKDSAEIKWMWIAFILLSTVHVLGFCEFYN